MQHPENVVHASSMGSESCACEDDGAVAGGCPDQSAPAAGASPAGPFPGAYPPPYPGMMPNYQSNYPGYQPTQQGMPQAVPGAGFYAHPVYAHPVAPEMATPHPQAMPGPQSMPYNTAATGPEVQPGMPYAGLAGPAMAAQQPQAQASATVHPGQAATDKDTGPGHLKHDAHQYGQLMGLVNDLANGKADPSQVMTLLGGLDGQFLKGALVGIGATLLLTNDAVKATIAGTLSGIFGAFGKEKKETTEKG